MILGNVGIAADRDDLPVGVLVRAPFLRCAAALTPATGLYDRAAVRDFMPFPCSISLPPCARRSVPFEAAAARPQSAQHVRTRDRHHCHISGCRASDDEEHKRTPIARLRHEPVAERANQTNGSKEPPTSRRTGQLSSTCANPDLHPHHRFRGFAR